MKKSIIVIALLAMITGIGLAEKTHYFEVQAGICGTIFAVNEDFEEKIKLSSREISASIGYVYKFNDIFSLGGWVGTSWNMDLPVIGGIKCIFFDKEKFALSLNLGQLPSMGVYVENFIVNVTYIPSENNYPPRFFMEAGYSFGIF